MIRPAFCRVTPPRGTSFPEGLAADGTAAHDGYTRHEHQRRGISRGTGDCDRTSRPVFRGRSHHEASHALRDDGGHRRHHHTRCDRTVPLGDLQDEEGRDRHEAGADAIRASRAAEDDRLLTTARPADTGPCGASDGSYLEIGRRRNARRGRLRPKGPGRPARRILLARPGSRPYHSEAFRIRSRSKEHRPDLESAHEPAEGSFQDLWIRPEIIVSPPGVTAFMAQTWARDTLSGPLRRRVFSSLWHRIVVTKSAIPDV